MVVAVVEGIVRNNCPSLFHLLYNQEMEREKLSNFLSFLLRRGYAAKRQNEKKLSLLSNL